jgi:hypothetical protein
MKQFVLSNGEEVIAELISWPDPEQDEDYSAIIKNPAQILMTDEALDEGIRYYVFRPFVTMQEIECLITLSVGHVVSMAIPNEKLVEQYKHFITAQKMVETEERLANAESGSSNIIKFDKILH